MPRDLLSGKDSDWMDGNKKNNGDRNSSRDRTGSGSGSDADPSPFGWDPGGSTQLFVNVEANRRFMQRLVFILSSMAGQERGATDYRGAVTNPLPAPQRPPPAFDDDNR
jgi:hypothetical protein